MMEEKENTQEKPSKIRIYLLTILLILVLLAAAALAYWLFTPYLQAPIIEELAT